MSWGELQFLHPAALALLPVVAALGWWLGKAGPVPSIAVPSLRGLAALGTVPRRRAGRWRWWFRMGAMAIAVVALARPRVPRGDLPDPSKGIDIMLTLDFSRSMAEPDFHQEAKRVTRRAALESVVTDFVGRRANDRIGIVCFARNPYLVSPLTLDHAWALDSMRQTDLMTGTGIGEAIAASVRFLRRDSERSRVIILVTDGDNSAGRRPMEVAPLAVREKIKVYTILIGPEIVTPSAASNHELSKVARLTGGQFFQAVDLRGLKAIYEVIDQLEKKELVQKRYMTWRELFPWLVAAASGLFLAEMLIPRPRRIP